VRKFAAIGVAAALVLGVAACGSSDKPSAANDTTTTSAAASACGDTEIPAAAADFEPVVAETLSVVTSLPGPGFWEGSDSDPSKVTSGYEYDIAKQLQESFGLKNLEVRNVSFDAIVAGQAKDYDIAFSQAFRRPRFEWRMRRNTRLRAIDDIGDVHVPVSLIHVKNDWLIAHRHSIALYERANEPKELHILDVAGNYHADRIFAVASESIEPIIDSFLDRFTPR
jgi:hypothetical protein